VDCAGVGPHFEKGYLMTDRGDAPATITWITASGTGSGTGVQVAERRDMIAFRDSRDPSAAPFWFTAAEWQAFVAGVKNGEFDHLLQVRPTGVLGPVSRCDEPGRTTR
jgi:hypothetical protein